MKTNKKRTILLALLAGAVLGSGGCSGRSVEKKTEVTAETDTAIKVTSGEYQVVCTNFPQYDFINQIIGDNPAGIEVIYLLGSGVDMHNYQASAEDMIKIRTSDLFIYVGGESEQWVNPLIQQMTAKNQAIALMDMVETKDELIVEGMEHDHEDHDHEAEEHDHETEDHDHETEINEGTPDEHVWLSLKNAVTIVNHITDELCQIDSDHEDYYKSNAAAYVKELEVLDQQYQNAVDGAARKTILVADRFPFRYLADDYQLEYYAAFPGCSAETEASFETIIFLAEKINEKQLPVVLTIDGSDGKIARTVIASSEAKNAEIKTLNSIQSISADDIHNGTTYLGMMEDNLIIIKEALN